MADISDEKFGLLAGSPTSEPFIFADGGEALDFTSISPKNFIWAESGITPPGLEQAAMFSAFTQEFIGYAPLDRDRFEIRIYRAEIFPDRVALAADYGRLLAGMWARLDFGVAAHNPDFGEVLGGDNSSGLMIVNRITVLRRADHLLIIRTKFHAEHFKTYASDIATFIGSITFRENPISDPISADFNSVEVPITPNSAPFRYTTPANWIPLTSALPIQETGRYDLWVDGSDPNKNGGLMIAMIPPLEPLPTGVSPNADPQKMANLAATMTQVTLENLLPGQQIFIDPVSKNSFGRLDGIAAFNALFLFKAKVGPDQTEVNLETLLSMGPDGTVLGSVVVAPTASDLYLKGTNMHVRFVQHLQLEAQIAYWGE